MQLPYSGYIPQQWPIPPIWNTNNNNWYNNATLPPEWHGIANNMWRAHVQNEQLSQMMRGPLHGHGYRARDHVQINGPVNVATLRAPASASHGQLQHRQASAHVNETLQLQPPSQVSITSTASVPRVVSISTQDSGPVANSVASPSLVKYQSVDNPVSLPVAAAHTDPSVSIVAEGLAPIASPPTATATASSKRTSAPSRRGQLTRGELCALKALSEIFPGKTFEKIRPDWLINDRTSRALEIDLYNDELRLGVEHSGLSHYCFPNSLHKTREEFDQMRYRDQLKQTLCAKRGVLLIEIPFTVPHASMEAYIRSEIDRLSDDNEVL